MGWLNGKQKKDEPDEPMSTVILHDEEDSLVWARQRVEFSPKPADLVEAVERASTPPVSPAPEAPPLRVAWTTDPPLQPGVYWWVPLAPEWYGQPWRPLLALVTNFGGRPSVRTRRGDASTYVSVTTLARQWAGPLPLPVGMDLERIDLGCGDA